MVTRNPTVLFVEDSDLDFELAQWAIRRLSRPLDIVRVSSHQSFQKYLAEAPSHPSLVVMDIRLPDASGIDIAREIRQRGLFPPETPVVLFSTSDVPDDRHAALRLGVEAFETKPIDATRYLDVVQQIVQKWVPLPASDKSAPSPSDPAAKSTGPPDSVLR